jgi:hypothetical protein
MALRVAVATGNWSNTSTWYLGVKPVPGDIVASNNFTITIDENVTVNSITNTAQSPVSIIPLMTSATTPSGTVTVSSQESSVYLGWKAFDGSLVVSSQWTNNRSFSPETLEYQFPTAKTVVAYLIQGSPTDWQFQAWNGSTWIVLDSVSGATYGSTVSRSFANTTAYTRYRLFITAPLNFYLAELRMFEVAADAGIAVAGGGFILTNGVTVTCTNELRSGNSTLLLWSGTTGNTIVSPKAVGAGSGRLIDVAGVGTLNINIATLTGIGGVAPTLVHVGAAATVNIVGTFQTVADIRGTMLNIAAAATVNVTGNFIRDVYTNNTFYTIGIVAANSILNITGDITTGNILTYWGYEWNITSTYTINITGSIKTIAVPIGGEISILLNPSGYLKVIGPIITYGNHVVYRNTNTSAINIFSGPFVCSTYGYVPLQVVRMHLIPSTSSYIEFRDETTNGALSPGAIAPATRLVSPATLVDNLAVSDVRFGTTYALGTLTGTLRMPSANQVTFGIPVDNTFGNAVLTAASVWDYLISNITVENSIGIRLKNVSTPQITGEQLEAFLRLD